MTNPPKNLTAQAPVPQPSSQLAMSSIPSATQAPSSIPLATQAPPPPLERTGIPSCLKTLNSQLSTLNSGGTLVPSAPLQDGPPARDTSPQSALLALQFTAAPLESLQNRPAAKPRNGKIAHLPKLEREMVNRMLANNLPQSTIVAVLEDCGFHVTERNVSNWKTRGGYKEWCVAQARALELRTFQDNLTEFLRRHDAAELSEVGLQSAATNLSAILLRPDLMRELLSDPEKYSKLIELQCRLAREIQALQKNRDDAAKSVGCNSERL